MAKKATKKGKSKEPDVVCADCQFSTRNTSGPSFNIDTGIFFMGTCSEMEGDGIPGKVFMDTKRKCKKYQAKQITQQEPKKIDAGTQFCLF